MNRLFPFLLIILVGQQAHGDEPAFPLSAKRILFLGDSITNSGYYVADIECQLRLQGLPTIPEFVNIGLSSETCTGLSEPAHPFPRPDVHERLDRALERVKPDVVVACYGMNDAIYHPFSTERFKQFQAGMTRIVEKVHAAEAKIVVLTPPPFDPLPLKGKPGKLAPKDAKEFAWFAIYEQYDKVIKRYSDWILSNTFEADLVVDIHAPILAELKERRRTEPAFHVAHDGVHMNEIGHEFMSGAILAAWGVESWEEPTQRLNDLMNRRQKIMHDAWLTHVGHQRPGVKPGLPIKEAKERAAELLQEIKGEVKRARKASVKMEPSTGGNVYTVHFPADISVGSLKLNVDYFIWIPDNVERLRGVVVHQHGCGPGASLGGKTAVHDLHWQDLARRQQCALMGSSYEPRQGANCRLWCDPRQGSASRFLQSLDAFSGFTEHKELNDIPWCLWGHSGGGFWASLMQTMYPERIVAIWLQSGTAFGYWTAGEIPVPDVSTASLQIPVIAAPGAKEESHERFQRAYRGSESMAKEYKKAGAPFFLMTPDPLTSHECGDSRYLAIPFFDFWLSRRIANDGQTMNRITAQHLTEWNENVEPLRAEFLKTGRVSDSTPPPPPESVTATASDSGTTRISWTALADSESGIRGFVILHKQQVIAEIPESPKGRFGRPLFQTMSYHDTPESPLPAMTAVVNVNGQASDFGVQTVNGVGMRSAVSPAKLR